jgi:hypothetical protein
LASSGLLFDGTDDFASSGEHPLGSAGTLICVARALRSYPSDSGSAAYRGLLAKTSSGLTAGIAYALEWNGTNASRDLRLLIGDGAGLNSVVAAFDWQSSHQMITGRWGGGALSLWAGTTKLNEAAQTVNANAGLSTPLKLGQVFSALANCWDGSISFAAVYSRSLSESEIRQAYRALRVLLAPLTF